jgi:hypothetical protein
MGDPPSRELAEKPRIWCVAEQDGRGISEEPKDRSVLTDDRIEERRFGQQVVEIAKHTAGRNDDQNAGSPRFLYGRSRLRGEFVPNGDRAVEIKNENP